MLNRWQCGVAMAAGSGILTAGEVKLGKHVFTLPEGFEIELAAGPPLVDRPIVADYDEAGHLYVADSAGVNDKVQKQLEERPHRIVRLTDVDGDGVYDKSVVFADRLMFPEGLLWHDGAVYCAAPPSIWKLEDTDGDGVAEKRTEWFNVGTLTGCANDLHGPYLGPAGWIYWTKGAFAKLDLEMGNGSRLTNSAAHIFRARPDGTGLESYAAGGMDNPVDVTFGEAGDVFFSSTFLVNPALGRRDGLIHSIYGSVYPKRHGVIDGLPRTGDLMPALSHLGPSASCGLTTYRSKVFGSDFRGDLFSCLFNMRKVMRHQLKSKGASYQSEDSDFVVSDQVDFHPTDVQEDADGSLLILDTGGWYKLCCPTSVIAKPEVLGAIYRVRRSGAEPLADARGAKIEWFKLTPIALTGLLDDPRPTVRDRAIARLAAMGHVALPVLRDAIMQSESEQRALGALWSLARIRTPESAEVMRLALGSSLAAVQQAGAYTCGLERDGDSFARLVELLKSEHPRVRREAATALGRLGNPEACEDLLACRGGDRFLEHAIIYALIEINAPDALRDFLQETRGQPSDNSNRVLWALEGMPQGKLRAEEAIPLLGRGLPLLPIIKRHPQWGDELAVHFKKQLLDPLLSADQESQLESGLGEFLHWPEVGKMVSDLLLEGELSDARLQLVGESSPGSGLPDTLIPGLEMVLLSGKLRGTPLLRRMKPKQLTSGLARWLSELAEKGDSWAIDILAACHRPLPQAAFEERVMWIGTEDRWLAASECLGQADLSEAQKLALTDALPRAGAVELEALLAIYESGGGESLGKRLAQALAKSSASRSVSQEAIEKLAASFPESVRGAIRGARPAPPDAAETAARLEELASNLPPGDRLKGHQVFRSTKSGCNACHRVGYDGGAVGPDLTRIGAIRSRRDLLEAIVAPSASYARGYEPMIVTLNGGEKRMGIVRRQGTSLSLRELTGKDTVFNQESIQAIEVAPLSLMPAGIDQILDPNELADLIAFLESLK